MWPSSKTKPQNICHFQKSSGKHCGPCLSHMIILPIAMCWRDLGPTIFQRALLGASLDYLWRPTKMLLKKCVSGLYVTYLFHYYEKSLMLLCHSRCFIQQLSVISFYIETVQRDYKHCVETSHSILFIIRWTTVDCDEQTLREAQSFCKSFRKRKKKQTINAQMKLSFAFGSQWH